MCSFDLSSDFSLNLYGQDISKELEALAKKLRMSEQLEVLTLTRTSMGEKQLKYLCPTISRCLKLTDLYLDNNQIGDTGVLHLSRLKLQSLKSLSLVKKSISSVGLKHLETRFSKEDHLKELTDLYLNENQFDEDEAEAFLGSKALIKRRESNLVVDLVLDKFFRHVHVPFNDASPQ